MSNAAILLQARMGSTRLPGKAMASIEGESIVSHCIARLRARSGLPVVLVTTTLPEDDVLEAEGARHDVTVIRGAADDVLSRFVQAATTLGLEAVVRATADNPAVDLNGPRRTLDLLTRTGAGYVVEHGLPYGAAVEAISCAALKYADVIATEGYDREHVTPVLRRDRRFVSLDALAPADLRRPEVRLTVDTAEDLDSMRDLYSLLRGGRAPAPTTAFIAAWDRVQELRGEEHGAGAR